MTSNTPVSSDAPVDPEDPPVTSTTGGTIDPEDPEEPPVTTTTGGTTDPEQPTDPNRAYYDLFVKDGLIYHLNFASATEGAIVESNDSYLPFVVDKETSVTNPWSGNKDGSFGDGYVATTKDSKISFFGGGVSTLLSGKTHVSVEFVAEPTATGFSNWYVGPSMQMAFYKSGDTSSYGALINPSGTQMGGVSQTYFFNLPNGSITTYAFTFGFNNADGDAGTNDYALGIYGNGKSYSSQNITTTSSGFVTANGGVTPTNAALNIYAFRVYTRELTKNEVLQNHFADIALINKLDISAFVNANSTKKADVYAAFENVSASDTGLQDKLDAALQ